MHLASILYLALAMELLAGFLCLVGALLLIRGTWRWMESHTARRGPAGTLRKAPGDRRRKPGMLASAQGKAKGG
jgi:hypothetical protein